VNIEKANKIIPIIVGLIAIGTVVISVDRYFSRSMDKVSDRQDISVLDSQVYRQEQRVIRAKEKAHIKRKKRKPTPVELDLIKAEEMRLLELEARRNKKIEQYEEGK